MADQQALAPDALALYRRELFDVQRVTHAHELADYHAFLRAHYEPLGFFCAQVLPEADSMLFQVRHRSGLAAIFRLTPVRDPASAYFTLVPGARTVDGRVRRLLEVNNVVIARAFRASIVLGLILYHSACQASAEGYDFVVGMNRFQILRFFVDFGVVPVEHPPQAVLGKDHLQDFVNYYDTADPASLAYMHERARRYFHQELVMRTIHERHVRPKTPMCGGSVPMRARART